VACTDRFDSATGYVILSTTGVCLIHCVELAAATLNLESVRLDYMIDKTHIRLFCGGYLRRGGCTVSFRRNMTTQIQVLDPRFDGSST
jgi:hypothetical protein